MECRRRVRHFSVFLVRWFGEFHRLIQWTMGYYSIVIKQVSSFTMLVSGVDFRGTS